MARFRPITPENDGEKCFRPLVGFGFAASNVIVPIVALELGEAAQGMPLGFVKQDDGFFVLVAVLGIEAGSNLYLGPDGRWLGSYTPLLFRTYPLRLFPSVDKQTLVLCVDEDAGALVDLCPGAEPIFGADKKLAPGMMATLGVLEQMERSRALTTQAVGALAAANLLCPWQVSQQEEKRQLLGRLYRVDEVALNRLSDEVFTGLRHAGALPIAYAQLLSMTQLRMLTKLKDVQARIADAKALRNPQQGSGFALSDSQELRFD